MTKMSFKKGDTFFYYINLTNSIGEPLDVDLADIKSQLREPNGELIDTLVVTDEVEIGRYKISATDTSDYPVAKLEMDIKIKDGVNIISTDTVEVTVIKAVTTWE